MRVAIMAAAIILEAASARAQPAAPDLTRLEVDVWTMEEQALGTLENEVVRAIQMEPKSVLAHHLLSHILLRQFTQDPSDFYSLKQAGALAQQAIDLAPTSDIGYVAMADVFDVMGNSEKALAVLDEIERSKVKASWRVDFTRARLSSDRLPTAKVLALFERALASDGAHTKVIVPYVIAMLQSEMTGEALVAELSRWNQRFSSPLFELTSAITLAELGEHARAHTIYAGLIARHPALKEAKVNDAIILYRDLKEPAKATALFENVLAQHSSELTPNMLAMIRAHLGAAYLAQKRFDRAEESFVDAVKVDSRNMSIMDFITRSYRSSKAHEHLAGLLRKLNTIMPGRGVTYALLGETLSESLKKHDEALSAFADAIILDPSRSDYYNGMGLAYYRKRAYNEALKLFETAGEVDPNDATARYNEACVLALLGRRDDAIKSLGEALALDPRLTRAAQDDGDFIALREIGRFRELVQLPTDPLVGQALAH